MFATSRAKVTFSFPRVTEFESMLHTPVAVHKTSANKSLLDGITVCPAAQIWACFGDILIAHTSATTTAFVTFSFLCFSALI